MLRSYGLSTVTGDAYAGQWPAEQFRKRGISYRPSDVTKSQVYLEALAPLNSGRFDLLDDPKLVNQIVGLERRTARAGRDSVDPMTTEDELLDALLEAHDGAC